MPLADLKFFEIVNAILYRSVDTLSGLYAVFSKSPNDFLNDLGLALPDWIVPYLPEAFVSWSLIEWCFGAALFVIPGIWLIRWIIDTFNPFN